MATEDALTTYAAYGRAIQSDMPLPELEATSRSPDIFITGSTELLAPGPAPPRALVDEDGDLWLLISEVDGEAVLSFPDVVDCVVDLGHRRIACHLAAGADPAAVRHALLDHVLPRFLVATGSTVLHASAVLVDRTAVLFAGRSGSGKSTLAARCAAGGYPVLADDAVVFEVHGGRVQVHPSYPGLRLWPGSIQLLGTSVHSTPLWSGTPKRRVDMAPDTGSEASFHELTAIVMIERRPGATQGRRLTGAEAFSRLWGTVFAWPGTTIDQGLLDRVTTLAREAAVLSIGFADGASVKDLLSTVARLADAR